MNDERWKPHPTHSTYEVSTLGRVRRKGKILNPWMGGRTRQRPKITIYVGRARVRAYVHILVLETFVGPRPWAYAQGCHNDDNPSNNALSNLRWDSAWENQRDIHRRRGVEYDERLPF